MIRNILFDFDGVIIDSMHIRDIGFRAIVEGHDETLVEEFIKYHRINGGLSRYHKIRYFYEEMLSGSISEEQILSLADKFSRIMTKELVDPSFIIEESRDFLEQYHSDIAMHVVSGSDEEELNYLCQQLELDKYFITIKGSPTHKNKLVEDILDSYAYQAEETIVIGDTVNDLEAAQVNGTGFYGYNNPKLKGRGTGYIETFRHPPFQLALSQQRPATPGPESSVYLSETLKRF